MKLCYWLVLLFISFNSLAQAVNKLAENPLYHVGTRTLNSEGKTLSYQDRYLDQIQPLLGARCVACHGCFEAPCQLNLQSYEGLRRGFKAEPIYSSKRLLATYPTRMIDANSIAEWRKKEFFPVVDATGTEPEGSKNDPQGSVMYQLLAQGKKTNQPGFGVNNLQPFQEWIDENSRQVCVARDSDYDTHFKGTLNLWGVVSTSQYLKKWPAAGMPFGLPVPPEHDELTAWVTDGAVGPSAEAQAKLETPANQQEIERWEDFLNDRSHKGLHVGRYIYEHVYTAHINFKDNPGEFFFLVRAKNRKGKIDQMVTALPYDPPSGEVFYRFKKITQAIVHKTHFVWNLDDSRLARLKQLFVEDWTDQESVVPAPRYVTKEGHLNPNPFEYFAPIPAKSRARFMIENSRVIVAAMTQGSVCVGTSATFAINDHFWAWFLNPDSDVSVLFPKLGLESWDVFATAVIKGENAAEHFARTALEHAKYEVAYEVQLRSWLKSRGRKGLSLEDLWRGDGDPSYPNGNPNAWLNITRHDRSATVQYGSEGGAPMSIWVMSYSNFERLYYNLVASFQEWGSVDHKSATWRHMSYVRIEGEDLAISFLPTKVRKEVRDRFARGISYLRNIPYPQYSMEKLDDHKHLFPIHFHDLPARAEGTPNLVNAKADAMIAYLVEEFKKQLPAGIVGKSESVSPARQDFERQLEFYQSQSRKNVGLGYARSFANVAYVRVEGDKDEKWIFSLIANRAYEGHNDVFRQKRTPQFDTFSVYRGFVGGYPNVVLDVEKSKRRAFIEDIAQIGTKNMPWDNFRRKWGVARNSVAFWPMFDELHAIKAVGQPGVNPLEQGIADLSQYEIFQK